MEPEIRYQVFKNGMWLFIPFEQLKCGDTFRIIVGGAIHVDPSGKSSVVAKSDPYIINDRWRIDT